MEMSLLIDQANATRAADAEPDPTPDAPEND
jgi:ribosome-binding factor A